MIPRRADDAGHSFVSMAQAAEVGNVPVLDKLKMEPTKLSRRLVRCGLTRGELAERAELSSSSVARAFASAHIGVVVARKIAAALGVSIADLILPDDSAGGEAKRTGGRRHDAR